MDRATLGQLHAKAADILHTLLSGADCAAIEADAAVVAARVPLDVLDDAFAVLGALEDLEDGHDREADFATVVFENGRPVATGRTSDDEPTAYGAEHDN
jgi:hypothetical protein